MLNTSSVNNAFCREAMCLLLVVRFSYVRPETRRRKEIVCKCIGKKAAAAKRETGRLLTHRHFSHDCVQRLVCDACGDTPLPSTFPYVCPEPVLANDRVFHKENSAKRLVSLQYRPGRHRAGSHPVARRKIKYQASHPKRVAQSLSSGPGCQTRGQYGSPSRRHVRFWRQRGTAHSHEQPAERSRPRASEQAEEEGGAWPSK
jgi:hypothetical protein